MKNNYSTLVENNHIKLFDSLPPDFDTLVPCEQTNGSFQFPAFGATCTITHDGFYLDEIKQTGVPGILISLYALNVSPEPCITEPYKAYKEFPGTMPYVGAFATHTEAVLVPYVDKIKSATELITKRLNGIKAPDSISGDFGFVIYPLPKIALCYIFYEADEDFPPSVTCLYSNNASQFIPNDALADVGEYTSKRIIEIISNK